MNRQAVPVSGTGHALVDLAGVARVKAHGEIAHKGLTNYVYDDDNSIKFLSRDLTESETVCAAKSSETKEDLATPKIIGSQAAHPCAHHAPKGAVHTKWSQGMSNQS